MRALRCLLLLAIAVAVRPSHADGAAFGKGGVASMPDQRAIISIRDGKQTMIIQPSISGREFAYSWVVPLPVPPELMDQADESALYVADDLFSPDIVGANDVISPKLGLAFGIPFVLMSLAAIAVSNRDRQRAMRFVYASLLFGAGLFLGAIYDERPWAPTEAAAGALDGGVSVLESTVVGRYKVDVIRGSDAGGLMDWLNDNKTPLPEEAQPIVDDYIRRGWCFVAGRLQRDEDGYLISHPLLVRFPTSSPVYPMRLTSLIPDPLELELFVVASGTASVPPLEPWLAQRAGSVVESWNGSVSELQDVIWPSAIVTRLRATVAPEQMANDYPITIGEVKEFGATRHEPKAAKDVALWWAQVAFFAAFGVAVFQGINTWSAPRRYIVYAAILSGIVFGVAVGLARYFTLHLA